MHNETDGHENKLFTILITIQIIQVRLLIP